MYSLTGCKAQDVKMFGESIGFGQLGEDGLRHSRLQTLWIDELEDVKDEENETDRMTFLASRKRWKRSGKRFLVRGDRGRGEEVGS
ncbi:hypothetical protein Tco_1423097, partial [Tanacetum coccineum]